MMYNVAMHKRLFLTSYIANCRTIRHNVIFLKALFDVTDPIIEQVMTILFRAIDYA